MTFRSRPGLAIDRVEGILEDMECSIGVEIKIYGFSDLLNCFIRKKIEIE